ncbi:MULTISPECIES: hypothetical protein [Halomicrobium]|uniref:Uncharacterized protein n=2 Tax=Halomicrobium mukohataei TaxID=57705 RepID=C7P3S8_HALMD|nr:MULTISPECIES: hypothetical protein [Halomicrobium]ACV47750.1 conserved hypothetical protein [Halomicrobium mukohataei DSM 12286]QCD66201.1 hypothetical protein E5139_11300 [Halomicrobium mukohataei]QFR21006.1 hypothetical protein GBQ70_11295 [Halomicrobium sp. ZPS1]
MVQVWVFTPLELVGLIVALVGLIPVLSQYKEETKWFTAGYVLLVVGMVATNIEALLLGGVLNFVEHGIGVGLAGLVFLVAAYVRRRDVIMAEGQS